MDVRAEGVSLRMAQLEAGDFEEDSKPRHECGVFGVFSAKENAARVSFFALYALNHRAYRGARPARPSPPDPAAAVRVTLHGPTVVSTAKQPPAARVCGPRRA